MRYTLVQTSVAFAAGIAIGLTLRTSIPLPVPWSLAGALTLAAAFARRTPRRKRLLLFAVFALGVARATPEETFPPWLLLRTQRLTEVTGTVLSYPSLGDGYVVFTLRPDTLPGDLRVTWRQPPGNSVLYGDRLTLAGSVRLPEAFDDFDYPAYLARRGIFATMFVAEDHAVAHVGVGGPALLRLGDRIRQALLTRLAAALGPDEAALAQGLLLGDRTALSDNVEDAFRRSGLMHVLAVSGLHLGIALAGLWFALRWARVRPAIAYPLVALVVLAVLWIVGPRVSLIRASLLFAFLGLGSVLADLGLILRRTIHPLNGLAMSALVLLALWPSQLTDAGFQLTFAATAGILIAVSDRLRRRREAWIDRIATRAGPFERPTRSLLTLAFISTAAQAGVAPVVAWPFGTFHPLLVGFNLIVVPLVSLALWTGLPSVLLLAAGATRLCAVPFGWILCALSESVRALARTPLAELLVPRWIGLWLAGCVAFLVASAVYSEDPSS